MSHCMYLDALGSFLRNNLISKGYKLTHPLLLDRYPQNAKYDAMEFSINGRKIIYRKGNITPDRPGNFCTIWKRPDVNNAEQRQTMPYEEDDLDYLFVEVGDCDTSQRGFFIFPQSVLVKKGIVTSDKGRGKMALRVFPPWTSSRGEMNSRVFSDSAKKTQRWQGEFFVEVEDNVIADFKKFTRVFQSN